MYHPRLKTMGLCVLASMLCSQALKGETGVRINTSGSIYSQLLKDLLTRSLFVSAVELVERRHNEFVLYQMKHKIPGKDDKNGYKKTLGVYSTKNFKNKEEFFGPQHFDFEGGLFNLASWCFDKPFIDVFPPDNTQCQGISLDILSIIAKKHKFSFDVQLKPADARFGSKENGTWTGMLADLLHNGKNLVINYFIINRDLYTDFDTTYPYFSEGFAFLLPKPLPLPKWLGLFFPFSIRVWIYFLCTTVIVTVMFTIILFMVRDNQSYDTSFLLMLSAILRQSYPEQIKKFLPRIWMMWWRLTSLALSLAYTSNLVAFLTIPISPSRIEAVSALAASNLRIIIADYGSFVPGALKESEDKSLHSLGQRLDLFPIDGDDAYNRHGFPKVQAGTHALADAYSYLFLESYRFHIHPSTYIMKEQIYPYHLCPDIPLSPVPRYTPITCAQIYPYHLCPDIPLSPVPRYTPITCAQIYPGHLVWILPKNTPYTSLISSELQRLVEVGLVTKLYKKHMVEVHKKQESSVAQALELANLQGSFFILGSGFLLASAVFMAEVFLKRDVRRTQ
ncbi:Ionotropic glutamate receptor [Trinorchestia longiramus]|nr:Ionotropic glutamate receptor [Trinorchestia longiramus]